MSDPVAAGTRRSLTVELVLLWAFAIGVHVLLGVINLTSSTNPFGDVNVVYPEWMEQREAGVVPAVDAPFVYPILALVPMLVVDALAHLLGGHGSFGVAWLVVVGIADGLLLAALTLVRPHGPTAAARRRASWWWVVFTLLLGPVAVGRIDAFTVPVAVAGLLAAARWPFVAGAVLTVGAWIKVWPAAAFIALVTVARRDTVRVIGGAALVCAAVLAPALLLGGWPEVFSFVSQQTGRGLQIEAPLAAFPMIAAAAGAPGYDLGYDLDILTFQITGPGTAALAAAGTPLMLVLVLGVLGLGVLATRRGAPAADVFLPLAFGLVLALIVTNKVGSPQFVTWLGAVLVVALIRDARRFRAPAIVALAVAALTQLVYPWGYNWITSAHWVGVAVLETRNALYVLLLAWTVVELWRVGAEARRTRVVDAGPAGV